MIPAPREEEFHHGAARRSRSVPRNATRYLCAAAYVEPGFADRAIAELIEAEHRAVVPAYGHDVEPVLLHCLRSRRLALARDAALTLALLAGLWLLPGPTAVVLCAALVLGAAGWTRRQRLLPTWKVVAGAVVALVLLSFVGAPLAGILAMFGVSVDDLLGTGPEGYTAPGYPSPEPADAQSVPFVLQLALVVIVVGGILLTYYRVRVATVAVTLAPGARHVPPRIDHERIAERVRAVAAAQHGNVVMHAGFEPFLGAGRRLHAWSMVLELRNEQSPLSNGGARRRVDVDPVELNRHLKRRLAELRSDKLPERERVAGLALRDYVIATGYRNYQFPLIDLDSRTPFAFAGPDAVNAVIRHPQGAARHFLRVTTGTEGHAVVDDSGYELLPAQDQEIEVSAFVHAAVEGGMLYLEFVATRLGPLRESLHEIDTVGSDAVDVNYRAFLDALRNFGADLAFSPYRFVRNSVNIIATPFRMNRSATDSGEPAFNFGARESLREMLAEPSPSTYTADLDAVKYRKLFERRVTDAVLDYLESQHIDTSEYRARVNVLHNEGTILQNSTVNGAVAGGQGSHATASAPVPAPTTGR